MCISIYLSIYYPGVRPGNIWTTSARAATFTQFHKPLRQERCAQL